MLTNIKTNTCVFGGWFPIDVVTEDGSSEIGIVDDVARTGRKSLRTTPNLNTVKGTIYFSQYNGGEEVRNDIRRRGVSGARTIAFRLDQDIVSCDASVWIKKAEGQKISLKAIWYARRNRVPFIKIGEHQSNQPDIEKDGWYKYSLHADRYESARQVQIAIVTDGEESFHIDDVEIYFNRTAHVEIRVDQLGYEPKSKSNHIILQSTKRLRHSPASFSLVKPDNNKPLFTGEWKAIGYNRHTSPPFEIRHNLLVSRTGELAYRFYYYQRCGTEIPAFHKACHLDDSIMLDGTYKDLTGGWHDAGDYNKYCGYTPESVYALAVWGAKYLKKCIDMNTLKLIATVSSGYGYWGTPDKETDNIPQTGDERPVRDIKADASACIPGFALLGKYLPEYLILAERLYENHSGNMQTILALYNVTHKQTYREAGTRRQHIFVNWLNMQSLSRTTN